MKLITYECGKCRREENQIVPSNVHLPLKKPCSTDGACDGTMKMLSAQYGNRFIIHAVKKKYTIETVSKPKGRPSIKSSIAWFFYNMNQDIEEWTMPKQRFNRRDDKPSYKKRRKYLSLQEEQELRETRAEARAHAGSKIRMCALIHKKQVLAELNNDKDSLFTDENLIESMLKIDCKSITPPAEPTPEVLKKRMEARDNYQRHKDRIKAYSRAYRKGLTIPSGIKYFFQEQQIESKKQPENKENQLTYYETHKDKYREYNKKYYQAHRAEINAYQREWRMNNKEKVMIAKRKSYSKNKDKIIMVRRLHYEKNKEKYREVGRQYYQMHKEKCREIARRNYQHTKEHRKAYYESHRDEILAKRKAYYAKKKEVMHVS